MASLLKTFKEQSYISEKIIIAIFFAYDLSYFFMHVLYKYDLQVAFITAVFSSLLALVLAQLLEKAKEVDEKIERMHDEDKELSISIREEFVKTHNLYKNKEHLNELLKELSKDHIKNSKSSNINLLRDLHDFERKIQLFYLNRFGT